MFRPEEHSAALQGNSLSQLTLRDNPTETCLLVLVIRLDFYKLLFLPEYFMAESLNQP